MHNVKNRHSKGRLMDSLINYLDAIEFTTLSETLKIENANYY